MTLLELFAILLCLFILAVTIIPGLHALKLRARRINCVENLKQDGLAARIWEGDNNNFYPMQVSVTNGGGMELIATNFVAGLFRVMSNELSTSIILRCPADTQVIEPTNNWQGFGPDFSNKNISYFVGMDTTNHNLPNRLLFGDDNFEINGTPVPSGVAQISKNAPLEWDSSRHHFLELPFRHPYIGNLGFADGSVQEINSTLELRQALIQTGLATNRLAIP